MYCKYIVLCFRVPDNSVRHTHIQIEQDGPSYKYFLVVEKKFKSVQDLVEFYRSNPVKNLENVDDVFFLYPMYKPGTMDGSAGSRSGLSRASSHSSLGSNATSTLSRPEVPQAPPPLPIRPRTISGDGGGTSESGSNLSTNSLPRHVDISRRPPAPLPQSASQSSNGDDTYFYSRARDVTEDVSEKLKDALKSSEKCECGIPRNLAELPLGWTVHLSKDQQTFGRLFYQSEEGVTSWSLPQSVQMQLTKKHHENLKLIDKNWSLTPRRTSAQRI